MMLPMVSRGELEQRVMELLWQSTEARTVTELHLKLGQERELAYTTVMTVLDRLAKKGLARRELVGRAWQYEAADPQHVVVSRQLAELVANLDPDVRRAALRDFQAQLERIEG